MSITEEKKKKRRTTVIRKTYPDWYPWVSLGLGGYGASGEQSPAPVEFTGTITGSGGGGEGGGAMGESVQALFQAPNYHKSLMIPRANMPQIATADIPDFLSSLPGSTSLEYLDPNELAPSQGEFDMEKVDGMSPGAAQMPIMVSKDGYVVDGHHRWLANAKMGLRQPAYVLPVGAKVALQMMDKHPASFNKGINEHIEKYFGGAVVAGRMSRLHEAAMSEEDNAHFRAYTMNARYVNDALKARKQDIQSGIVIPFGSKPDEKHAAAISESISKMPALNRDMTVYTGTSDFVHPGIIQKFSNGVFHHPSFISTSPSIDVAKRFTSDKGGARHILKLDLPAGFNKGAFMEAHSSHNESEYLIDHNQMLGISHKVDDIQDHEGRPVEVWQAHILSPEEAAERANGNEYAQAEIEAHKAFGVKTLRQNISEEVESKGPSIMEGSFEKKREEFVKTLKKKKSEFVDKYGEDWENVLYGTATNMAKKATS